MARGWIETLSPLERDKGSRLLCNGRYYNYQLNAYGHYVAEVLNDEDYASTLSIGAGYRPYKPAQDYPGLALPQVEQSAIPLTRETPPVSSSQNSRKAPQKKNAGSATDFHADIARG